MHTKINKNAITSTPNRTSSTKLSLLDQKHIFFKKKAVQNYASRISIKMIARTLEGNLFQTLETKS